ncbi:MAG: 2-phospho-L-lactate transferase CofD family protein, partial [Endomicrobia bacterium]|nr:2-phospho-L-lactate transferase CofD family protein [Endomicrobiia bacterium]
VNLLVDGVVDSVKNSKAYKIYVCNIMTQPGETKDYKLSDHIKAIEEHSYKGIIDCVLTNKGKVPQKVLKRYRRYGSHQVESDKVNVKTVKSSLFSDEIYARHDSGKLADAIVKIIKGNKK